MPRRDKLGTEEYRMLENEQGLVALNPRYSPKLIREVAMGTPSGAFETGVCFLSSPIKPAGPLGQ